ncbi:MAG: hypothetical protein AAF802_21735 [Planctomycetota bacterium]
MEIERLAHRGFWREPEEKNTRIAFKRAFDSGFGIETDVRDQSGVPVISHDPPCGDVELTFADFLTVYRQSGALGTLALNIKSDGLTSMIVDLLEQNSIPDYFVFDMSVPDMLHYLKRGTRTFCRQSEFETPSFLRAERGFPAIDGIWLDSFQSIWYSTDVIRDHLMAGRDVCLVSPELHRRECQEAWSEWRRFAAQMDESPEYGKLMLCTDFPDRF